MLRDPTLDTQLSQAEQDIIGPQPPGDINGETLSCVFIHDRQQFHRSPVLRSCCHEVIGPDMIWMGGAQSHTRPIG